MAHSGMGRGSGRIILAAACLVLVGGAAGGGAAAQSRQPIERSRFSPAYPVRDIEPGSDKRDFTMATPARVGDFFVAWSLTNPNSCYPYLWSINVVTGRATLLKEISPYYDPVWWPEPFFRQSGQLYFSARAPGEWNSHLWETDGTPEGTRLVVNSEGFGFDFPAALTSFGGHLYFFAERRGDPSPARLWRTDGTPEGTTAVGNIPGLPPSCIGFEGGGGCGTTQPPTLILGGNMVFVGLSPELKTSYALFSSDGSDERPQVLLGLDRPPSYGLEKLGEVGYFEIDADWYQNRSSQLWRTDGTPSGTWKVKDICLGFCTSSISYRKAIGQTLFFFISDIGHGSLWKSDGTPSGTVPLKEVVGESDRFEVSGRFVYFVGYDEKHGYELWRTDGTPEGTQIVKDIRPGSESAGAGQLVSTGSYLFFFADDGAKGPALWRTDGTEMGTVMLKETAQAKPGAVFRPLVVFGSSVYFSAEDPIHGVELWSSDGTVAGTRMVADINEGSAGSDPFLVPAPESRLLFLARGPEGVSLWDTDGSALGTRRITRIDSGAQSRSSAPSLMNDVAGQLFFFTRSACSCTATSLWSSDGSESGTERLEDLRPSSSGGTSPPISAGGGLYFNEYTGSADHSSFRFWRVDGLSKGITKLADSEARAFATVGDTLYFNLDGGLWKAEPGRDQIAPIEGLRLYPVVGVGGFLYAAGGTDPGIWKTDGTKAGTALVQSGSFGHLTGAGGLLYYTKREPPNISLWVTSPWSAGSTLVRRFPFFDIYPDTLTDTLGMNNLLFFLLSDGRQWQLWRSDGTESGTFKVSEVPASGPLAGDGTGVFFIGFDAAHGYELWRTNGTREGTGRVRDIFPGPGDSGPAELKVVDGVLLFSADDAFHGRELWTSDGTEEGTRLFEDLCPGACSSRPAGFTTSGGKVFFSADDGEIGNELWAVPASSIHARAEREPRHPTVVPDRGRPSS